MFFITKKKEIIKTEYKLKQMNLVLYQDGSVVTQYKELFQWTFKQNFDYIPISGYSKGKKKDKENLNCVQ